MTAPLFAGHCDDGTCGSMVCWCECARCRPVATLGIEETEVLAMALDFPDSREPVNHAMLMALRALSRIGVTTEQARATLSKRLLKGMTEYGALDLANDDRDFMAEIAAECFDILNYGAMHVVREQKRAALPLPLPRIDAMAAEEGMRPTVAAAHARVMERHGETLAALAGEER